MSRFIIRSTYTSLSEMSSRGRTEGGRTDCYYEIIKGAVIKYSFPVYVKVFGQRTNEGNQGVGGNNNCVRRGFRFRTKDKHEKTNRNNNRTT